MCLKFRKTMPGDKVTDAVVTRKDAEIILVTTEAMVADKPDEKDSIIAMSRVIKTEIEE